MTSLRLGFRNLLPLFFVLTFFGCGRTRSSRPKVHVEVDEMNRPRIIYTYIEKAHGRNVIHGQHYSIEYGVRGYIKEVVVKEYDQGMWLPMEGKIICPITDPVHLDDERVVSDSVKQNDREELIVLIPLDGVGEIDQRDSGDEKWPAAPGVGPK